MITYLKGDIFSSPAQVLVNTVNTVGVMGKGVALECKKRYPEMFLYYQELCDEKKLDIGNLCLWKDVDKWILLFPTKKHWRNPSKLEYIEAGLKKFVASYYKMGIESIAFPRLGCGNGQLKWKDVKPLMEKHLGTLPIQIFIYVDHYKEEIPEHEQEKVMENWLRSQINSVGFGMIKEDLQKRIVNDNVLEMPNGENYQIDWREGIITIRNGSVKEIEEEYFCSFWNYVRETGVFRLNQMPEQFKEYADCLVQILKKLDYLQDVIVSDNGIDFGKEGNGFQYTGK